MTDASNNKDLHFKGQYAGEVVVAFFRAHWLKLVPAIAFQIFVWAVVIGIFIIFPTEIFDFIKSPLGQIILLLSVGLFTYFIHNFFIKLVNHFLSTCIITNLRIIENQKTIFLKDLQVSLDLKVVQDVHKEQNGILENLFNCGELLFMMSSSDIRMIHYVPNPNFHFRLVNRIKLEVRQKQQMPLGSDRGRPQSLLFEDYSLQRERDKVEE